MCATIVRLKVRMLPFQSISVRISLTVCSLLSLYANFVKCLTGFGNELKFALTKR